MDKSIRLRTTPGVDKNIQIKVEQDFDFLEVLSLKIGQTDIYNTFCADYGTVVGRVIANNGYGVPNAKVSIFIPITDEDINNDLIRDLYPYRDVTDTNGEGVRYNLLLSQPECDLNTPVGTFPSKDVVLNNDIMIEIFDKYYKYTTKTNDSGDYMILGVPTGQQTVHMDVDLSNAGPFSPRPYDFIEKKGYSEKLFDSRTRFKSSNQLDDLPQIKTINKGIEVIPFWGDEDQCSVGITRVDFDTKFDFEPNAIYMGSLFTDQDKNSLNKGCNPTNDQGNQCELRTGAGEIDVIRVEDYVYGENDKIVPTSLSNYTPPQGFDSVDDDGNFVLTLPMNVGHVITNEAGELVPSNDPSKGVPTKGLYRFKMKMTESINGKRRTASIITPSLNSVTGGDVLDFTNETPNTERVRWTTDLIDGWYNNNSLVEDVFYKDFHEFNWNQIYTISQYIPKYKKGGNRFSFLGIKGVDECPNTNPLPFNNAIYSSDIVYGLLSFFTRLQAIFLKFLIAMNNFSLCFVIKWKLLTNIIKFFGGYSGYSECVNCDGFIDQNANPNIINTALKYRTDGELKRKYVEKFLKNTLLGVEVASPNENKLITNVRKVKFLTQAQRDNWFSNQAPQDDNTFLYDYTVGDGNFISVKGLTGNLAGDNSVNLSSNVENGTRCDVPLRDTSVGNTGGKYVFAKVTWEWTDNDDNDDSNVGWVYLGHAKYLPAGVLLDECDCNNINDDELKDSCNSKCIVTSIKPFGFLVSNKTERELPCESQGTVTVSNVCKTGGCNTLCNEISSNFGIKLGVVTPKCCYEVDENGEYVQLPDCDPEDTCDSVCKTNDWLCCSIFDLAIQRQVIRYTFHDAWLNGSVYLPQFKIKQKVRNQDTVDEYVDDNFCGAGADNRRGDNYKNQKCSSLRGRGLDNSCIVRGPEKVFKDIQQFSDYHNNDYKTGASDSGEFIYCPETYPTKIVNIGRTDACDNVTETIGRIINNQGDLLSLYTKSQTECFTGTYYYEGYDPEQWTDILQNTSYDNPALLVINLLQRKDRAIRCNPRKLFKSGNGCDEFELEDDVWKELHEVSKLYVDINTKLLGDDGSDDFDPDGDVQTVFEGFSYDLGINEKFHPSSIIQDGTGYPLGYYTTTDKPYDTKLGDRSNEHHFRNSPYFYFGINPGKTSIDKLRRLYLTRK